MKAEPQPGEVYFVDLGMADKPSFQRRPMALSCKPIEPGFKVPGRQQKTSASLR